MQTPTYARTAAEDSLDAGQEEVLKECLRLTGIQQTNNNVFVTLRASEEVLRDRRSS